VIAFVVNLASALIFAACAREHTVMTIASSPKPSKDFVATSSTGQTSIGATLSNGKVTAGIHITERCLLGRRYMFGDGVSQDFNKAFEIFSQGATAGDACSVSGLGRLYNFGWGVRRNYKLAMRYYIRSSNAGFPDATANIGEMYLIGEGVARNDDKADEFFHAAAARGSWKAYDDLGLLHRYGQEPADYTDSIKWFQTAFAHGVYRAGFDLAMMFYNFDFSGHYETALSWFMKSNQITMSQYHIGDAYLYEEGAPRNFELARFWLGQAANHGSSDAMFDLAKMMLYGTGGPQDIPAARRWLVRAAADNEPSALNELGKMAIAGGIITPSKAKVAAKYFAWSAKLGDDQAQENLGELYQYGLGVPKDPYKAYVLFLEAALANRDDPQRLREIQPRFTAVGSQLPDAQKQSAYTEATTDVMDHQIEEHTTTFGRDKPGVEVGHIWVYDG
jgi:uncharacterized protein